MARVLGVVRRSKADVASLSIAGQKAAIEQWALGFGHEVIGWTEDDDGTKGDLAPWKRPGLGPWLPSTIGMEDPSDVEVERAWRASRVEEWDVVVAHKLDRFSRSVIHAHQFLKWSLSNGRGLVILEPFMDMRTKDGHLLFGMLSTFAEAEHAVIKERARHGYRARLHAGRWAGGTLPYGYRPERDPEGKGWYLVPDDDGENTAGQLREIIERVLAGESQNSICESLNAAGVPTSRDVQRIRKNQEPKGYKWRPGNLGQVLRNHSMLGFATEWVEVPRESGGTERVTRPARGENGLPIKRAEPLISRKTWDDLQIAINERGDHRGRGVVRSDRRMLLRVLYCECGAPMYTQTAGGGRDYYVCSKRWTSGAKCPRNVKSMRADRAEAEVAKHFLDMVGRIEVIRREWFAGVDYSADIADINDALARYESDREAGLYDGDERTQHYRSLVKRLVADRNRLRALPTEPGRWEDVPTGETYRERWERLTSDADRNAELRASGMQAVLHRDPATPGEEMFARIITPEAETEEEAAAGIVVAFRYGRLEVRFPHSLKERVEEHVAQRFGEA